MSAPLQRASRNEAATHAEAQQQSRENPVRDFRPGLTMSLPPENSAIEDCSSAHRQRR